MRQKNVPNAHLLRYVAPEAERTRIEGNDIVDQERSQVLARTIGPNARRQLQHAQHAEIVRSAPTGRAL